MTEAKPPPTPKPLPITLDTVQLCIANAERLLADSVRVSEPTAVALAEIALEEVLKGWVLCFHRVDQDRDAPPKTPDPLVEKMLSGSEKEWTALADSAKAADPRAMFESHGKKLDQLDPILESLGKLVGSLTEDQFKHLASSAYGPAVSLKEMSRADTAEALASARAVVGLIQKGHARRLRRWAEQGLYVDLTRADRVVDPLSETFLPATPLREVVRSLLSFLKGFVRVPAGVE